MPERVYSVSEINGFIARLFESNSYLKRVTVEGEISNLTRASSGHLYFSLKDRTSEIRCIMWRSSAASLKFKLQDGQSVKITGAVKVYEQRGTYSIIASKIEPVGIGTLYQIFVERVKNLEQRGYFSPENKKELPEKIKTVGVVTSETGAVIHDIITTVESLDPTLEIILVPAVVQGEGAKESIAEGIRRLNDIDRVDVIIVGRGGGSLEDLWAFNELEVAQAIYQSQKPVISSVGHETDVTISDMIADLRAATPTAAAQFVSFGYGQTALQLESLFNRLIAAESGNYNNYVQRLERLENLTKQNSPENRMMGFQFKIDELELKIRNALERKISTLSAKLQELKTRIELLNPTYILKRGYVMVTDRQDHLIKSVKKARTKNELILHFDDGNLDVEVEGTDGR